ncbi:unnamed protein product [Urochloa decumbens]|uniref:Uncharacterized protein n=1 Tax=Urochloa decumbens TaxID=240449 RepID=A0ABC9GU34_9POAL
MLVFRSHGCMLSSILGPEPPVVWPLPGCRGNCGNVSIPFPFGIGAECAWRGLDDFTVHCDDSFSTPRLYTGNVQIESISAETSEMRVFTHTSYICYDSPNNTEPGSVEEWSLNSTDTPFLISPTRNVFTAIGCNTEALLVGREDLSFLTGCITTCVSLADAAKDGDNCTGLGCCQTAIPGNLSSVHVPWKDLNNRNPAWEYSPCMYAFVADKHWYNFTQRDLNGTGKDSFISRNGEGTIPMVVDWAIRKNGSCPMGPDARAPACVSNHSQCINATNGGGYICKCSKGYEGNPYMPGGCKNINECTGATNGPCGMYSRCEDTEGDYNCKCKFNHKGDGKSQQGCHQYIFPPYAIAAVVIFIVLVPACSVIVLLMRQKQRKLFNKNGGDILKGVGIIIFTEGELKKITDNYSKPIGGGFFGNVYMGKIDGAQAQHVAVKRTVEKKVARHRQKTLRQEASQNEQEEFWKDGFVKEITFQFQIKHPNVVRLVGCCLETEVPKLVFEFVRNGSLQHILHGGNKPTLSLPKRLDIAIGSAEALSHMHSHGDYNHVHGDIKPANILLDEDLKPKVSDFGSSKLLSVSRYVRDVASDGAYTDTAYYKTGRFTVKSDVYSFGVVLLELITRKTAKYDGNKSLPLDFVRCCKKEGNGRKMYDKDMFLSEDADQSQRYYTECLDRMGALAVQCLKEDVEERPTMAEVVEELKQVKSVAFGN